MAKVVKKSEKVWKYVVKNKLATPAQVAKATGVSYGYVHKLMSNIGTPREVFEAEAEKLSIAKANADKRIANGQKAWRNRKDKNQRTFEKSILTAPIREPFLDDRGWRNRMVQALIFMAIISTLSLWFYTAWN